MRFFRWALLAVLLSILGMAVYQTMLWYGFWGNLNDSQVKTLDDDDQEIAFIEPATSIDDWGRLVSAVKLLQIDWPKINPKLPTLTISDAAAFPKRTADVPEIALALTTAPHPTLRLRWYKITGEHDAASWIRKLQGRKRPPLAILGGATSDRAVRMAQALQATYPNAGQPSPVFLITTATSEKTAEDKLLIDEYPERSFRYSFTNKKMVEALLKFVKQTPDLWVTKSGPPPAAARMHTIVWKDERYSQDLNELFADEFKKVLPKGEFNPEGSIPYSVGDFFQPSPLEQYMVGLLLSEEIAPQSFLVLPTQSVRMRRFLINLYQRSPRDARNLAILNGDAISFNTVYRDRDVLWNILDVPYSLVFFSHRNPIDRAAGFRRTEEVRDDFADVFPQRSTTGTHDVLLYRDILESVLYAAYDAHGNLLGDSLKLRERLRATAWYQPPPDRREAARVCNTELHAFEPRPAPFFTRKGNRSRDTGEHIVWVKPNFTEDRVDLTSQISVWSMLPDTQGAEWKVVESFPAKYNQNR